MLRPPWILRALWNPPLELDLCAKDGAVDHGKVTGYVFFVTAVVLKLIGHGFDHWELLILAASIYGQRTLMALIKSRAFTRAETASSSSSRTVTETIVHHERDAELGVQPTP